MNIFFNEINGYCVGIMKVKETNIPDFTSKSVYFVGSFHELKLKSDYIMYGEMTSHPKYGEQFNVCDYELLLPEKKDEIITFLSSDMFPIGESLAKKIFNKLGNDAINKIIDNKDVLLDIPRLSEEKIDKIYSTLLNYEESSKVIINITKMGFSLKDALSIYKRYNTTSINMIDNNIYNLISELDIPFCTIDEIALKSGIDVMDERRVNALIIFLMNSWTFETGWTYISFEQLQKVLKKYSIDYDNETLAYVLIKLNKCGKIKIVEEKYFLTEFYNAELNISNRLLYLNRYVPPKKCEDNLDGYIEELQLNNNIKYDDTQIKAIKASIKNDLTIITGGPGTGKTTIIKAIVSLMCAVYKIKKDDITLLAPTGRAAKKMAESVVAPASTIHRFLGYDMDSNTFNVNEFNISNAKYIIIDEVSMIDTLLLDALLKGLRTDIKLVMVGDYHQLPSVGQGQVLKDIIDSDVFPIIKLDRLYRQNDNSYITTLAYEIKNKNLSENCFSLKDDYNFIECPNELVTDNIISIINHAKEKEWNDKRIQVLAPMYKSNSGIDNLNVILRDLFNESEFSKKEIMHGDIKYREGDKVLQLTNDVTNNVFNGDIGYIKCITSKREIIIDFDGNLVTYHPKDFINFRHAYAISVHKSQGSEYDMVILPIVSSFKRMLYNKLIYTAVTRAKSKLIIVGSKDAFLYSVNNDHDDERKTILKELLQNGINKKKL